MSSQWRVKGGAELEKGGWEQCPGCKSLRKEIRTVVALGEREAVKNLSLKQSGLCFGSET